MYIQTLAITDDLGNFFDFVVSSFNLIVNFIKMLVDDIDVMLKIGEVAVTIPNLASLLLWSPLSACMGIVMTFGMIKMAIGALT